MTRHATHSPNPEILKIAVPLLGIAAAGGVLGHPSVAFVVSGMVVVWVAVLFGLSLVGRLAVERDPGRELLWDLLLTAVILLALVGVGLMTAPLT